MTDTANTIPTARLADLDTIWYASTDPYAKAFGANAWLYEQIKLFDPGCYRADLADPDNTALVDRVVQEDWENVWTQGDGVYATREEAEAAAEAMQDEGYSRITVLEITREDVRGALLAVFGPDA